MKGKIRQLDMTGDSTVVEWDTEVPASLEVAREEFNRLAATNLMSATEAPGKSRQLRDFDPEAREILVIAPLIGG